MKNYFWPVIMLLIFHVSCEQAPWYQNYQFSDNILEKLSHDSINYIAANELSYIGEYEKMLAIWDLEERKMPAKLTIEQINYFSKFKAINALDLIRAKANTEQIIIINEAHQQPYHRVFTISLLHDLYKAGFRYFGAETISNYTISLKEIQKNKYPTINSGYYTREPFYGNLVREAINEGYEIFGYETTRLDSIDSSNIIQREIDQAKNIKKILDKNPKAKILIHCGWGHIFESSNHSTIKMMAGRLSEYTGINPFTIDQTDLTEHSNVEYHSPYWSSINLDYYAMFIDSFGQTFYGPEKYKQYDARVYHPKTKWLYGRPHWVFENNRTPYFIKKKITVTFPCLVFAFILKEINENKNAIPFDIIELKTETETDKKALSLKKEQQYTIILRDKDFKEQKLKVTID